MRCSAVAGRRGAGRAGRYPAQRRYAVRRRLPATISRPSILRQRRSCARPRSISRSMSAGDLQGGESFSILHGDMGWRLYEISTVVMDDATSGTITFNPPLRQAIFGWHGSSSIGRAARCGWRKPTRWTCRSRPGHSTGQRAIRRDVPMIFNAAELAALESGRRSASGYSSGSRPIRSCGSGSAPAISSRASTL
jgi:hypothetical protein